MASMFYERVTLTSNRWRGFGQLFVYCYCVCYLQNGDILHDKAELCYWLD